MAARMTLSAGVNRLEFRQSRTARISRAGSPPWSPPASAASIHKPNQAEPVTQPIRIIISSRSRMSSLLFSSSWINWL